MEITCGSPDHERCDAVDSDCDGAIDEAPCGSPAQPTGEGAIQVAASWSTGVDVDLTVQLDARGHHSAETPPVPLDPSLRTQRSSGDCAPAPTRSQSRIEMWSLTPPRGATLQVGVVLARSCGVDGPTMVAVSVSHPPQPAEVYNIPLASEGASAEVLWLVPRAHSTPRARPPTARSDVRDSLNSAPYALVSQTFPPTN